MSWNKEPTIRHMGKDVPHERSCSRNLDPLSTAEKQRTVCLGILHATDLPGTSAPYLRGCVEGEAAGISGGIDVTY
jgi:hypothetical protein